MKTILKYILLPVAVILFSLYAVLSFLAAMSEIMLDLVTHYRY